MKHGKAHKLNKDIYNVHRTLSTGVTPPSTLKPPLKPGVSKLKLIWTKGLVITLLLLIIFPLTIGAWNWRNYSRASEKLFGSGNLLNALKSASLRGSEIQRVNIMAVGYSRDDPGHDGASLTDSIMIISFNTTNRTGYMLSIPRDLYVPIPTYGRAKINEAFQHGESTEFASAGYSPGGMGILEKTIYDTLGIEINYFALINYSAVRQTADALGGLTVNIESNDPRGLYDPNFKSEEGGPLKLPIGIQKIDGMTALRLVRARGATYGSYGFPQSDFDRTKNQQAVVAGIKKSLNWNILLNPTKNETVLNAVASNVRTNVSLNEALPLFRLFRSIPESSMKSISLREINGKNLLAGYNTPSGQSALIPAAGLDDYRQIKAAINAINLN